MAVRSDALKDQLFRSNEINLIVIGRKSGRAIARPVWFVLQENTLSLLPVKGSETEWYKNVLKNPSIRIGARGAETELKVAPVTDAKQVASVVEKFRAKYGRGEVQKYYSKLDVAVIGQIA